MTSTKRHALLVGSFVLVAIALIVTTVLWLGGGGLFQNQLKAVIYFEGSVSGLYVGAPVTFRGVPVGQVDEIGIEVDADTLAARIPVRVRLQPDQVRLDNGEPASKLPDLPALVKRGLRARLVAQSFVTGQKFIDLDFVPDAPAKLVGAGREVEIPALADRFGALIDQVAELPLRETVQELRGTLQSLQKTLDTTQGALGDTAKELGATAQEARHSLIQARQTLEVASAAMLKLQSNAEATLASITRLSDTSREAVLAAQPELQRTLGSARAAAESAQLAMERVAELTAPGASVRGDLDAAVRDLSQAARGLREWAEILEERPNAVIFGSERR